MKSMLATIPRPGLPRAGASLIAVALTVGCASRPCPPVATPVAAAPVAASTMAAASSPATTPAPPPTRIVAPTEGGLGEIAQAFLARYRAERNRQRAQLGPVVVVSGDDLTLFRTGGGEPEKATVIPPAYHVLKAAAHLPFTAWLTLLPASDGRSPIDVAAVDALLASAGRVGDDGPETGLTPDQSWRQGEIVARSAAFLNAVRQRGAVSAAELQAFARLVGPLVMASADEAGCLQVEGMHRQMGAWRTQLGEAEWARLRVVVRARHQSRHRSVASQYFGWLLPAPAAAWSYPGENDRVVYAEYMSPGDEPLDLLAVVELDAAAAEAFFGDPHRLGEDLLADGAARCIASLPR